MLDCSIRVITLLIRMTALLGCLNLVSGNSETNSETAPDSVFNHHHIEGVGIAYDKISLKNLP